MYHFQSLGRNVDICGDPVIRFRNYEFSTDDEKIAERIRKNSCFGREYWEDNIKFDLPQGATQEETPKRRGRPPKIRVIDGARTTAELQGV